MSSEWIIVAAAVTVGALGVTQMIGGAAQELGGSATDSFAAIPTFGASGDAGSEGASYITETERD